MKITRLGHSCLLIEEGSARLLIDPGMWSDVPTDVGDLSAIFFTHEHPDHVNHALVTELLSKQPGLPVYANSGASKVLSDAGIASQTFEHGTKLEIAGVIIEGVGSEHAVMHSEWPLCANTGLLVEARFFYPGDALVVPEQRVEILALPVSGPWLNIGQAIDYAIQVAPKTAFPVHDGMLKDDRLGSAHRLPGTILPKHNIDFRPLLSGQSIEF